MPNASRSGGVSGIRCCGGWCGALFAVVALVAASCGADDPLEVASDAGLCELEAPSRTASTAAHDDDEGAPHDDDEEAPHDDAVTSDVDWMVDIEMNEFAYLCTLPDIEAGSTLAMHFTNSGAIEHEAVVGDLAAQNQAEADMAAGDGGDGHAHDAAAITLGPGESGTLVVELGESGAMVIGCHIPGHWDSGMRSDFTVSSS